MHHDREIGIARLERRDDGSRLHDPSLAEQRRLGELLLQLDEMEDEMEVLEHSAPPGRGSGGADSVRGRLSQRISRTRQRIAAMESNGRLDYGEIDRAMRLADAAG